MWTHMILNMRGSAHATQVLDKPSARYFLFIRPHLCCLMQPHASNFGLRISSLKIVVTFRGPHHLIKGRDNPTSQLLPIMNNKCCSGDGERRKTKEVVEDWEVKQVVCEELCVTKLHVKDGVLQRKMRQDQQDPARPFCTKQMKDITVRCNRLYSNLHTQVSQALPSPQCHQKS